MKDLLGRMGGTWSEVCLGSAVSGIMTSFPASEISSLSHAFRTFLRGKFLESNGINFHGIQVRGVSR